MHQPRNWSYIGQMYDANRVTRDPDLKWHLTYEEWPHDRCVDGVHILVANNNICFHTTKH